MQAAQGFGRRGLKDGRSAQAQVAAPPMPAITPHQEDDSANDHEALAAFQAAAKADWADARKAAPRIPIWKRYPGMTALTGMLMIFALITVTPLHMSMTALNWIRGGLTFGGLFGFGAKRLFRRKRS